MKLKKKLLSTLAALLAVLALSAEAVAAFAPSLLNDPVYSLEQNGFTYLEQSLEEGGVQKLFYGEYDSSSTNAKYEWVIHSIRDGSDTTLSTVMDIARDYEKQTGKKVMLASNGDYFYQTGANVESYVNDGIVISKGSFATKHCIGFDNKGKVVAGRMTEVEVRLVVVLNGKKTFFNVDQFNREPGENEIAIYTTPGTHAVKGAGKYICSTASSNLGQYPVFGSSRRMTTGSVENDNSFTLKSGQFAVVVKGENAKFFFDNILYGVEVDLVEIPAGEFAGCQYVLGGYDILVDDGKVNTNCHTDNGGDGKAPRTLMGFREDGTAFLCMVDGRQSGYSVGITVNQQAELAKALGAQYALELDGGGSTTVVVRIGDTLTLRNKPSDGQMRKVSNAVLLVEKTKEVPDQKPDTPPATEPPTPPATDPPATEPTIPPATEPPITEPTTPPASEPTTPAGTLPSTDPVTTPSTDASSDTSPDNGSLIVGIAVAAGAAILLALVLTICVIVKRKRTH